MLFSLDSKLSRKINLGHLFTISAKKKTCATFCLFHVYIWHGILTSYTYTMLIVHSTFSCVFFFLQYMHTNIFDKISSLLNEKLYPRMQCA